MLKDILSSAVAGYEPSRCRSATTNFGPRPSTASACCWSAERNSSPTAGPSPSAERIRHARCRVAPSSRSRGLAGDCVSPNCGRNGVLEQKDPGGFLVELKQSAVPMMHRRIYLREDPVTGQPLDTIPAWNDCDLTSKGGKRRILRQSLRLVAKCRQVGGFAKTD